MISIPQEESEIDSLRSEGLSGDATRTYLQGVVSDFVSEIQLMESFKGVQNIVSVEDYKVVEKTDKIGWDIYIRMELLTPFNSYICDKTLSENEVIKLGVDICTALELCAKRNVIHRDIKPENIFINQFGDFKLGDFGIARKLENVTGGLSQKGAYNYMAPEIEKGYQYDATVDLYSLGLVLYRLLNKNRLPFLDTERQLLNPNERMAAIRRRMNGEPLPAPCDASPAMAQVIFCACSPDPSKRFASATAMKNALFNVANGTYTGSEEALNKTVSVRHAAQAQDPNRTTSVRKAPQAQQAAQKTIDTFGKKKKSKTPAIIAAVLVVAFLIGGSMFAIPKLLENKDSTESDSSMTDVYSEFDEEQIAAAIEEAEALATDEDYEGALTKIKTALVTYPKSEDLQAKKTEYTEALAAQVKAKTLEQAATLAEAGDYVSAIALINNAQEANGEDADYTNAYNTYCTSYKAEIIEAADELANSGDYTGAIQKIGEATAIVGEDAELTAKASTYEDKYADDVISNVSDLISSRDYETATATLTAALAVFPKNQKLLDEKDVLSNSMPQSVLTASPPYETKGCSLETAKMGGETYTNALVMSGGYGDGSGAHAFFNLGGNYDTLEFDLGHVDGSRMDDETLEIILDGVTVQVIDMKAQDLPKHYIVALNGATQMKIEQSYASAKYAIVNAVLYPNSSINDKDTQSLASNTYLLTVCPPYETKGYSEDSTIKMGGQTYTNGFVLSGGYGDGSGAHAYFNLGGKYETLEFDLGHVDGSYLDDETLEIILDGVTVQVIDMKAQDLPKHYVISLNGATQLMIEQSYASAKYAIVNAVLY